MRKAIFTMFAATISVIALGASVQAAVITYSCTEPLTNTMTIRVDTETNEATETELRVFTVQGAAQVTDATVSFSSQVPRVWSIKIDRSTGASMDSDGTAGACQLVK